MMWRGRSAPRCVSSTRPCEAAFAGCACHGRRANKKPAAEDPGGVQTSQAVRLKNERPARREAFRARESTA